MFKTYLIKNFWIKKYHIFIKQSDFKKKLKKDFLLNNNFFSQYPFKFKFEFWRFYFSGFFLDELFSKIILIFFKNLLLTSFFIFDRWFSLQIGAKVIKKNLKNFSSIFYIKNLNFLQYFIIVIYVFFNFFILLFLIF